MGLRINQNIAAQNAYRNLSVTDGQMSKSLEKLSSGFRINRAADDAAGLSISEGLRSQTGGLKVAVRNAQDGMSVVQTAEGALNEVTSMLQRMRDLAVQTSSGGSMDPAAKAAAQSEFEQLNAELTRISETTSFGKSKLLDGTFGKGAALTGTAQTGALNVAAKTITITHLGDQATALAAPIVVSVGASAAGATVQDVANDMNAALKAALKAVPGGNYTGNEVSVSASVASDGTGYTFKVDGPEEFTLTGLAAVGVANGPSTLNAAANTGRFQIGANAGEKLDISIKEVSAEALGTNLASLLSDPSGAITIVDSALERVSADRATLGAYQNRLEHTINNLNVSVENLSASESRIRDTDMAQEMVSFTRNQILTQAGTAMLSQANQASQNVLSLLR